MNQIRLSGEIAKLTDEKVSDGKSRKTFVTCSLFDSLPLQVELYRDHGVDRVVRRTPKDD